MKETFATIGIRAAQFLRILLDIFWISVFVIVIFAAAGVAFGVLCKLWVIGYNLVEKLWPL